MCRSQRTACWNGFSSLTMWVPQVQHRSSGLLASTLSAHLSYQPVEMELHGWLSPWLAKFGKCAHIKDTQTFLCKGLFCLCGSCSLWLETAFGSQHFLPHAVPGAQGHFGLSFYPGLNMHFLPWQGAGSRARRLHGYFPLFGFAAWEMECNIPNQRQRTMSTTGVTLYEILGLHKGASCEEIKKTYRYPRSAGGGGQFLCHHWWFLVIGKWCQIRDISFLPRPGDLNFGPKFPVVKHRQFRRDRYSSDLWKNYCVMPSLRKG